MVACSCRTCGLESSRMHMTGLREVRKMAGLNMMDSIRTDTCYGARREWSCSASPTAVALFRDSPRGTNTSVGME